MNQPGNTADRDPRVTGKQAAAGAGLSALVLAAAAAAAHFAAPLTMASEGAPHDRQGNAVSYIDRLGRGQPPTICFGNTGLVHAPDGKLLRVKLGMKFPLSHCSKLLAEREQDDAIPIWRVTPGIAQYPRCWGAVIDFTHNFNLGVYQRSSIAREFGRGHWRAGADAFLLYNKGTVNGRRTVLPGLKTRREKERADCLIDLKGTA